MRMHFTPLASSRTRRCSLSFRWGRPEARFQNFQIFSREPGSFKMLDRKVVACLQRGSGGSWSYGLKASGQLGYLRSATLVDSAEEQLWN